MKEEMRTTARWSKEHLSDTNRKPPKEKPHVEQPSPPGLADAHTIVRTSALPFSFLYGGQPFDVLLPAWKHSAATRNLDSSRTQRTLTWIDPKSGLEVRLAAIEHKDFPAVEWLLVFTNNGTADTSIIESVQPLDIQIETPDGFTLHHSLGDSNSADSFKPIADVINPSNRGAHVFAPKGGRSSDGHMPYFNIDCGSNGVVVAIGWAGQWRAGFVQAERGVLRASAGQERTRFLLHPGESVRTPRIALVFWKGEDDLRGNNIFRQWVMSHYMPRRDGQPVFPPICTSITETAPDGSYEAPHVAVMPALKASGMEAFWFDMDPQHWYGDFPHETGTWEPHPKRFPNGLKPMGDAARQAGLAFLLWFEPERAHRHTKVDTLHPEWVMKPQGEWSQLFKLHEPEARKWLTDYIDVQVTAAGVTWMRWDFNIEPLGFWRRNDSPDRQGITEMRYVEGLYAMWQDLRQRHPGLLIDICASGGRRLDFETCSYGIPLWHSDMQCTGPKPAPDQLQNAGLWRWVPMHGCGNFDVEPSYVFRSAMTAGNVLAALNNRFLPGHTDFTKETARTVAIFKKVRPYMLGDFYPLFPHTASEAAWYGYQFDRRDLDAGMAMVFRRAQCGDSEQTVVLRAIDPAADYEVCFEDTPEKSTLKGKELANLKVKVPSAPGSAIVYYRHR